ncbi:MAG TPA: ABC transporter permease [Bryobacteraceae bacterium]|nr:ABC transporter permease [Bryobacteraceae bacterium]
MSSLSGQLKQVFRRLRRAPTFTFVAVLTLGLGIGANTAIFSVLEGVLLKPLPYPDPDRLVGLWLTAPGINIKNLNIAPSVYFTYREQNRSFQSLGVYTGDGVSVTGIGEPEQVRALDVTYGLFPTLGARPFLGRSFSAKDDSAGAPETIVLSYGYWQRRFGGDRSIIGKHLKIDGRSREVIGVMPREFRFLDMDAELFVPLQFDRGKTTLGNFSWQGVARLRPGVTLAQANADAARMLPIVNKSFPPPPGFSAKLFEDAHIAPALRPFKQDLTGDIGTTLWVLMGTIGIVLLIACANVANLLLVRVESRHLELTIRAALGASTARIAYELLLESLTVAVLGGVVGTALAFGALRLLLSGDWSRLPRISQVGIDGPVLFFAVALSLVTGFLFGLAPVLRYASSRLAGGLRDGGRSISVSRERHRARNTLVVVQVALALILLISSGLMIRTFRALNQVQPGFSGPEQVQTLSVYITEAQVSESAKVLRMEQDIADGLQAIPGVRSVAITTALPMSGNDSSDVLFARDHTYREGQIPPIRRFIYASPGLHQTMGTPLLTGRDFSWKDNNKEALVAMVSESLARDYWGNAAAALHKQIREGMNDQWREIVGVVGDVHYDGVDRPAPAAVYFPLRLSNFEGEKDSTRRGVSFVIRSRRAGSESFLKEVRRSIWTVNANLPLAQVRTVDDLYRKSLARSSFTSVLLIVAAVMAVILGSVGIYGVIAYTVSQRRREIGIRMALGARNSEVAAMFVRYGMLLVSIGAACGVLSALGLMRLLSTLLYGVKPADPLTYIGMSFLLLFIAFIASYLPSRRAAAVDPATALRLD